MENPPRFLRCRQLVRRWGVTAAVVALLGTQAGLLAYSATRHSPTLNEPGHLVAGLSHWKFGRFEVYCVNPPLTHYVSAIPVMLAGYAEDWSGFYDSPGARPEFKMGEDFIRANGERSIWLFTIARWACIPIAIAGGLFCFCWSRDLWGSNAAGLISLAVWCFEPNILAHGELITPDAAATSFGLGAAYLFWRWLRQPKWSRAAAAGLVLGLAQLSKMSWLFLFGLWPLLWLFWRWSIRRRAQRDGESLAPDARLSALGPPPLTQLAVLLLLALYLLNLGYGFDGSFTRLREFTFVSKSLTGLEKAGDPGNRFKDSWWGEIPMPVPKQYLRGMDLQKKDFEEYGQPSYLRGEWKQGGWWYYYIYGLAVKTPHGLQFLCVLAVILMIADRFRRRERVPRTRETTHVPVAPLAGLATWPSAPGPGPEPADQSQSVAEPSTINLPPSLADLLVLGLPPLILLVMVSAQLEFNHHVRYVLPVVGFACVLCGATGRWLVSNSACSPSARGELPG